MLILINTLPPEYKSGLCTYARVVDFYERESFKNVSPWNGKFYTCIENIYVIVDGSIYVKNPKKYTYIKFSSGQ